MHFYLPRETLLYSLGMILPSWNRTPPLSVSQCLTPVLLHGQHGLCSGASHDSLCEHLPTHPSSPSKALPLNSHLQRLLWSAVVELCLPFVFSWSFLCQDHFRLTPTWAEKENSVFWSVQLMKWLSGEYSCNKSTLSASHHLLIHIWESLQSDHYTEIVPTN